MRNLDLSSWQSILGTVLGIMLFALIGVGIRVLMMLTIQQRQQRANRQINERLRTLMAAYRTLGGSFTGRLTVDPSHLRDITLRAKAAAAEDDAGAGADDTPSEDAPTGSDRARRMRDAVEAALADIVLLGTEEQVRMAGKAAQDMAEGRPIHTAELVISLRNYIRAALGLEAVPQDVVIPLQGPTRPSPSGGKSGRGGIERGDTGSRGGGGGGTGGGMGGGGMGGGGMGMGMGMGLGLGGKHDNT